MTNARKDEVSQLIMAPAHRIYGALIDGQSRLQWLPPKGMNASSIEGFEARVGAGYVMTLKHSTLDAKGKTTDSEDVVRAQFVELTRDVRVVEAIRFDSGDPAFAGTMTMAWSLADKGGEGTLVTVTATNVPNGISAEDHKAGISSTLENLASYLGTRSH